jgi:ubiquinone/menaquinone biosynthesis C-methylase UbiE
MATDYPTAHFTGIDIVPLFPQDIRPVNVNFKQEDVLTGLSFEDNTFDFVQMRLFGFQFNKLQWATSLKEAYRVTKPGGYIQLLEAQIMVCFIYTLHTCA